jgi:hypothetical protein
MNRITALTIAAAFAAASAFAEETVVTHTTSSDAPVATTEKSTTVESHSVVDPAPSKTVKTETTKQRTTNLNGTVTKSSSSSSVSTAYTTRLESAYRAAGVADADITRLHDIDMQVLEARRANDDAKIKEYYTQQTHILKPEQVTRVRTYLTEHPVAVSEPRYYVSSYETVPATAGISITTPLGGASIGVPAGGTVVEKKEVVPANP